jgi:hypothetical protein
MRWFIDEFETFIGSLIDWCADSVTHRLTNSLIISYCTDSLIHWNIDWFIDSLIHNRDMQWCTESSRVMHWFIHGFIDSSTHYLLVDWFTDSLIHWFIDPLLRCFIDSLIHWFIDSSIHCHWFIRSVVHGFLHVSSLASQPPFAHWLMDLTISTCLCFILLPHLKSFPIGHWFLKAICMFQNFRPGTGRALSGNLIWSCHKFQCCGSVASASWWFLVITSSD